MRWTTIFVKNERILNILSINDRILNIFAYLYSTLIITQKQRDMKTYKITFGTGTEATTFIERNCVTFSEAVIRLEYTGLDFTQVTNIESEDE